MPLLAEEIPASRLATYDRLRRLSFQLSWIRRWRLDRRRRALGAIRDYYRFARDVFQLVQIEREICGFVEHVRSVAPVVLCEIGTRSCGTSFMLSQAVPSVATFVGVDLFVSNWTQFRAFARPSQQVAAVVGSSRAPVTVRQVEQHLGGRPIDVLFIDGDHSYAGVARDFLLYRRFVRDGGLIALHDVVPDRRAELGRTTGPYSGGVPTLWRQLKAAYPHHEFIADAAQEGFGIGAVTYSSQTPPPTLDVSAG